MNGSALFTVRFAANSAALFVLFSRLRIIQPTAARRARPAVRFFLSAAVGNHCADFSARRSEQEPPFENLPFDAPGDVRPRAVFGTLDRSRHCAFRRYRVSCWSIDHVVSNLVCGLRDCELTRGSA